MVPRVVAGHRAGDWVDGLQEIKTTLDSDQETSVDEQERLLDELCEIVEDIDFARGVLCGISPGDQILRHNPYPPLSCRSPSICV